MQTLVLEQQSRGAMKIFFPFTVRRRLSLLICTALTVAALCAFQRAHGEEIEGDRQFEIQCHKDDTNLIVGYLSSSNGPQTIRLWATFTSTHKIENIDSVVEVLGKTDLLDLPSVANKYGFSARRVILDMKDKVLSLNPKTLKWDHTFLLHPDEFVSVRENIKSIEKNEIFLGRIKSINAQIALIKSGIAGGDIPSLLFELEKLNSLPSKGGPLSLELYSLATPVRYDLNIEKGGRIKVLKKYVAGEIVRIVENSKYILDLEAVKNLPEGLTFPEISMKNLKTGGFIGLDLVAGLGGETVVDHIYPDSPADRAGVGVGDIVISINGTDLKDFNIDKVRSLMNGGEKVSMDIRRKENNEIKSLEIIKVPALIR